MFDKLIEIMSVKFQLEPADITPASTLQDLELDSLDLVELSLIIHEELGVQISDDELAEITDLAAVVALIEGRGTRV